MNNIKAQGTNMGLYKSCQVTENRLKSSRGNASGLYLKIQPKMHVNNN